MVEKTYKLGVGLALNSAIDKLEEARKLGDWNLVKQSYFELVELQHAILKSDFEKINEKYIY